MKSFMEAFAVTYLIALPLGAMQTIVHTAARFLDGRGLFAAMKSLPSSHDPVFVSAS